MKEAYLPTTQERMSQMRLPKRKSIQNPSNNATIGKKKY